MVISPKDEMFRGDVEHYLAVGQSALRCIRPALQGEVSSILDLPCGHGRVLRALREEFPYTEITACDLNRDGVDFCAEMFNAHPVYSTPDPDDLEIEGPFDLIWCGSLFTHMDQWFWRSMLRRFRSLLSPDGVLVFTTHGRHVVGVLESPSDLGISVEARDAIFKGYEETGFGYADYTAQPGYGISLSHPCWTLKQIEDFRLVSYIERSFGAGGLQDSVGVTLP